MACLRESGALTFLLVGNVQLRCKTWVVCDGDKAEVIKGFDTQIRTQYLPDGIFG